MGAPCGEAARAAEEEIALAFTRQTGRVHPKLGEHLEHAMWSAADLQALVEEAAAAGSAANVNIQAWPRPGALPGLSAPLQPVYPWLASRLHQAPTYRKIVFCQPGR
ncbi:hypothetical protein [Candidatus Amarolinea dominans]|uniref:hypothetical protein n=1 Tax=Candidatus Amarolinea dominans TaxID=3140696 RepID=UPI001D7B3EC8|nr:hypothetical protein [Anaerolineae bacterium]